MCAHIYVCFYIYTCIYTHNEILLSHKENEILPLGTRWAGLKGIMLR